MSVCLFRFLKCPRFVSFSHPFSEQKNNITVPSTCRCAKKPRSAWKHHGGIPSCWDEKNWGICFSYHQEETMLTNKNKHNMISISCMEFPMEHVLLFVVKPCKTNDVPPKKNYATNTWGCQKSHLPMGPWVLGTTWSDCQSGWSFEECLDGIRVAPPGMTLHLRAWGSKK